MADKIKLNVQVSENMPIPVDVKAGMIQQAVAGALKAALESNTYDNVELKLAYNSYKMTVTASMSHEADEYKIDLYSKAAEETGLPRDFVKQAAFYTTYAAQTPITNITPEEWDKMIVSCMKYMQLKEREDFIQGKEREDFIQGKFPKKKWNTDEDIAKTD